VPCAVWEEGRGLPAYEYDKLFEEGLEARIAKVEAKLEQLDAHAAELSPAEYLDKKTSWQATLICGRAIID
jgi:hypothetical protein